MTPSKRATKGELVYLHPGTAVRAELDGSASRADRGNEEGSAPARPARRFTASVTLLRNELYIEVQDAEAIELVDRALVAALLEAGVGAGKEGPHVATAVTPATCYGKVRVALRDDDFVRRHLEAARRAALGVLRDGRCLITERR